MTTLPKGIIARCEKIRKLYEKIEAEADIIQKWAEEKYGDEVVADSTGWDIRMVCCTYDPVYASQVKVHVEQCITDTILRGETDGKT